MTTAVKLACLICQGNCRCLLGKYPYRNWRVADGLIQPDPQHAATLPDWAHHHDISPTKAKLPSFGESSRKRKIIYLNADLTPFLNWWEGQRTVFGIVPDVLQPTYTSTNLLAISQDKVWTNDSDYQRHVLPESPEWRRRLELWRKLVDAEIEQRLHEEPERYRIGTFNQSAHTAYLVNKRLHQLLRKALRKVHHWVNEDSLPLELAIPDEPVPNLNNKLRVEELVHERCLRWNKIHLKQVAWVKEHSSAIQEPVEESGFAIDAPPTFPGHRAITDPNHHLLQRLRQVDDTCPENSCPELQYLQSMATRHYLSIVDRKPSLPLTGVVLGQGKIDSIKAREQSEYSHQGLDLSRFSLHERHEGKCNKDCPPKPHIEDGSLHGDWKKVDGILRPAPDGERYAFQQLFTISVRYSEFQTTKDEVREWNAKLREHGLPQEPRGCSKFKFEGYKKSAYDGYDEPDPIQPDEEAEEQEAPEDTAEAFVENDRPSRLRDLDNSDDSADTQKPTVHDACGTQWIDYRHESHNNDPTDLSVEKQGLRLIFNPKENTIADIKANRNFETAKKQYFLKATNCTEAEYYMKETGRSLTDDDKKLNTVIQQSVRGKRHLAKSVKAAEVKPSDPDFVFALVSWMDVHFQPDGKTEEGWYVPLRLNDRWMLHRLDCSFDKKYPLGSSLPNVERHAFLRLWREKRQEAEQVARSRGDAHAVSAARRRIDEAFRRVRYFYFLPSLPVPHNPNKP